MYQTYQETTQGRVNEPPKIITKKDLLYLQDALSWELLACKKANHFAEECQDPKLKKCLVEIGKRHQQNYQVLLNHVQPQFAQQQYNQFSQI